MTKALPAEVEIEGESVSGEADAIWLETKYRRRRVSVIVSVNYQPVPAALAVRRRLDRPVPVISAINPLDLKPEQPADAGVVRLNFDFRVFESLGLALALLPETRHVAIIGGGWPNDLVAQRVWLSRIGKAWPQIDLIDLSNLTLEALRERVARLPSHTICWLANFNGDAGGRPTSRRDVVEALSPHANAPFFDHFDVSFGHGAVGGLLANAETVGLELGKMAVRLLRGEAAESIRDLNIQVSSIRFDHRQLRRWNIPPRNVPASASIEFQEPTLWERYRGWFLAALGSAATLLLLLAFLLAERWRRQRSLAVLRDELTGSLRSKEIHHWNRISALGELTSSLAHEVNQPLSSILNNAAAAQALLDSAPATRTTPQLAEILADMQSAVRRAAAVVGNLRGLLRKNPAEPPCPLDLSEVTRETLSLVKGEAARRGVRIDTELTGDAGRIVLNRTQLQQVILNLLTNALDAAEMSAAPPNWIRVRTDRDKTSATLEVEDSGPGVAPEMLAHVFEPFHTTKPDGLGVGLSISRSIVVEAGGTIVLDGAKPGGALFRVSFPIVAGDAAEG